jgi:hypothetical protein
MSITAVAFTTARLMISPATVSVPVVMTNFATRVVVEFAPPRVTFPLTVADPALMFQAVITLFEVGWLIVTLPFIVSVLVPPCVNEFAVPPAASVSPVQLLLLFIVTVLPAAIVSPGKLVLLVPSIVTPPPVKVTVLVPPVSDPPLFVQFPPTDRL